VQSLTRSDDDDALKAPAKIKWLTDNGSGQDSQLCGVHWIEVVDDAGLQSVE
jgi:hypothetical protein